MLEKLDEKGNALVYAIFIMIIALVLGVMVYKISADQKSKVLLTDDRENALYYCQEGLNRYLWVVNKNSTFYKDSSRYRLVGDSAEASVYRPVDSEEDSSYRIEFIIPKVGGQLVNNEMTIRCTGWVPDPDGGASATTEPANDSKLRTVEMKWGKDTFISYAMVTNQGVDAENHSVYWTNLDNVYGPYQNNGDLYLRVSYIGAIGASGLLGHPVFWGPVTYNGTIHAMNNDVIIGSSVDTDRVIADTSIFRKGCFVRPEGTLGFPPINDELETYARMDGSYYKGLTCIMLNGSTYDVRNYSMEPGLWTNPSTGETISIPAGHYYYNGVPYEFVSVNLTSDIADTGVFWVPSKPVDPVHPPAGYRSFTTLPEMKSSIAPSRPLPSEGVIYVAGAQGGFNNYNFDAWKANTVGKFSRELGNLYVSGTLDGRLTMVSENDVFIAHNNPTIWTDPTWWGVPGMTQTTQGLSYTNTDFDINTTTGDVTMRPGLANDDMLGVIAKRFIVIAHYDWPRQTPHQNALKLFGWTIAQYCSPDFPCWGLTGQISNNVSGSGNIRLYGAFYSQEGSMGYEGYDGPDLAFMAQAIVRGSIAQQYMGRMGPDVSLPVTGYCKNYAHDPRMYKEGPPHFMEPENSGWKMGRWKETTSHVID